MKHKSYTKEFKKQIVDEYLKGRRQSELCNKYEINKSQLHHWKKQWKEFKDFPDGRGKSNKKGINKKLKQENMSDKEYIKKLEMEVDILKYMANLKNKNQSSNIK